MKHRSKLVYFVSSAIIGIIVVICILVGLMVGGVFDVGSRKLVFSSGSKEITYNGEVLTCDEWAFVDGKLEEGHTAKVTVTGKRTDAGTSENSFTVMIVDEDGNDVSAYYEIEKQAGELSVLPISLAVKTKDRTSVYTGAPLVGTLEDCSITSVAQPLEGHTVEYLMSGSQMDVGTSKNAVSMSIFDANGKDVTRNYSISYEEVGKLEVLKRPIAIYSDGASQSFGEGKLTCPTYSYSGLLDGHDLEVTVVGEQTTVGESDNTIGAVRITENGVDVTYNYDVQKYCGKLVVYGEMQGEFSQPNAGSSMDKNTSENMSSIWEELLKNGVDLDGDGIIDDIDGDGEADDLNNDGVAGDLSSKVGNDLDGDGIPEDFNNDGLGDDINGDGIGGDLSSQIGLGDSDGKFFPGFMQLTVAHVYSNTTGRAFLRLKSEGDYTGKGWSAPLEYDDALYERYGMNYLTGLSLEASGYTPKTMKIKQLYNLGYVLPYYLDDSELFYNIQPGDTYNIGVAKNVEYSMKHYAYNHQTSREALMSKLPVQYSAAELAYRTFVYENYIDVPTSTADYLAGLIAEQGWKKGDRWVVSKVAQYVQNNIEYSLDYDRNLDKEEDIVVELLKTYKKGICQHYASAATLIYRCLGIPARYTLGYVAETKANKYVDVKVQNAHAWVEVYLDGIGWVAIEATGGSSVGGDGMTGDNSVPNKDEAMGKYTVAVMSSYKKYDGVPLLASNSSVMLSDNLKALIANNGYEYEVVISGAQTEVGKSNAVIKSFVLYDKDGNDITDKYQFDFKPGELHVYTYDLTVSSQTFEKSFDGETLANGNASVEMDAPDGMGEGHKLIVNFEGGGQTTAGQSSNKFSATIVDENKKDVSVEYHITREMGMLIVNRRTLKIKSGSIFGEYNPDAPLSYNVTEIVHEECEGLADGHIYIATFIPTEEQVPGCAYTNEFEITIYNENGEDITANYLIEYEYGTLLVI